MCGRLCDTKYLVKQKGDIKLIILNKNCETCIHNCVCEKKGLRKIFETELSLFIESFDAEVMSEFNLSNQCKDYLELPVTLPRSYETQSAMTARSI